MLSAGILAGSWKGIEGATLGGPQPRGLLSAPSFSPSSRMTGHPAVLDSTSASVHVEKATFDHFLQDLIKNAAGIRFRSEYQNLSVVLSSPPHQEPIINSSFVFIMYH